LTGAGGQTDDCANGDGRDQAEHEELKQPEPSAPAVGEHDDHPFGQGMILNGIYGLFYH
jgi:hypothetical protein